MSLLGSHYVPQGFVKIDLIAVLDISGVPAVFQVSNSLCYDYIFVTEFSFILLKRDACFGVQVVFFDEDAHFRRGRADCPRSVQEGLNIPAGDPRDEADGALALISPVCCKHRGKA